MRAVALALLCAASLCAQKINHIAKIHVVVLSTMLADAGIGEWGFSALVEADGRRILFDTGARPETVLRNARELGIDLSGVDEIILSHNHADHTGGLLTLRREMAKARPAALARAHVGKGIFLSRVGPSGGEANIMIRARQEYEAGGGHFIEHATAEEIFPGAWLTGPVPRKFPERNWTMNGRSGQIRMPDGSTAEDTVPEDQSLALDTDRGWVIISGCAHAGMVNTIDYVETVRRAPVVAAIGGFHLFETDDEHLKWTAEKLRAFGLENLLGAHCTGIEALYRLRELTGLNRRTGAVGAVGATYDLDTGLHPGRIAH
ncbi:MAG TPA: MBL fold metallo-hydrolase [Bryobacteraceae bacterium]|nr:MBL fold metallo-hydrolase [Bryobacteraceae bacterium]